MVTRKRAAKDCGAVHNCGSLAEAPICCAVHGQLWLAGGIVVGFLYVVARVSALLQGGAGAVLEVLSGHEPEEVDANHKLVGNGFWAFFAKVKETVYVFALVPASQLYSMLSYFAVMAMTDDAVLGVSGGANDSVENSYAYFFAPEVWAMPPMDIDIDFHLDLWNPAVLLDKAFRLDLEAIELTPAAIIVVLLSSAAAYVILALDCLLAVCIAGKRCCKSCVEPDSSSYRDERTLAGSYRANDGLDETSC